MRKLYKTGVECTVDDHQVDILLNSGWSKTPIKDTSKPEEEISSEEVSSEDDVSKKVVKRRIKKIDKEE